MLRFWQALHQMQRCSKGPAVVWATRDVLLRETAALALTSCYDFTVAAMIHRRLLGGLFRGDVR